MSLLLCLAQTMEAEPPDMRYQALPGNEYNHLGLLYIKTFGGNLKSKISNLKSIEGTEEEKREDRNE